MGNKFYIGDFIRWVVGHDTFQSDGETLYGTDPIFNHGIVMEISNDNPSCIIVHSQDTLWAPRMVILDAEIDEIETLSSSGDKHG